MQELFNSVGFCQWLITFSTITFLDFIHSQVSGNTETEHNVLGTNRLHTLVTVVGEAPMHLDTVSYSQPLSKPCQLNNYHVCAQEILSTRDNRKYKESAWQIPSANQVWKFPIFGKTWSTRSVSNKKYQKDLVGSTFIFDGSSSRQVIYITLVSSFFQISDMGIGFLFLFDGIKYDCFNLSLFRSKWQLPWFLLTTSFITLPFNRYKGCFP